MDPPRDQTAHSSIVLPVVSPPFRVQTTPLPSFSQSDMRPTSVWIGARSKVSLRRLQRVTQGVSCQYAVHRHMCWIHGGVDLGPSSSSGKEWDGMGWDGIYTSPRPSALLGSFVQLFYEVLVIAKDFAPFSLATIVVCTIDRISRTHSRSPIMKVLSLFALTGLLAVAHAQTQCDSVASAVPACAVCLP